jgi:hypothetical protein
MKKPRHPDFAGKFVTLNLIGCDHSLGLVNPRLELQGDRWVFTGVVPQGFIPGNWCAGATVTAAWDQIIYYLVFDSFDVYRKGLESHAELKKSKRKA